MGVKILIPQKCLTNSQAPARVHSTLSFLDAIVCQYQSHRKVISPSRHTLYFKIFDDNFIIILILQ